MLLQGRAVNVNAVNQRWPRTYLRGGDGRSARQLARGTRSSRRPAIVYPGVGRLWEGRVQVPQPAPNTEPNLNLNLNTNREPRTEKRERLYLS
jgi:hypothetical protein